MASALDDAALESVTAPVQFTVNDGSTPVALVKQPGVAQDDRSGIYEYHDIVIRDGRPVADRFDLDRQGFALVNEPTAVEDFYDDDEVARVYYPEMDRLVKQATGASKVVVFDHTIRFDDPEIRAERKLRAPVRMVHNDLTIASAAQRVRDLLPPDEAEARLAKRYGSINLWRPIRGPVETAPLVICGWNDIDDRDLIASERHYGDRIGGTYNLAFNPDQRWYYFPRMARDEVILLKVFDSLTDGTARWTVHGSFQPPDTPAGAAPRESIEIRTLMFWD